MKKYVLFETIHVKLLSDVNFLDTWNFYGGGCIKQLLCLLQQVESPGAIN